MSDVLYAALGQSHTTSDLYTVNTATGVMTSVGPTGFGITGLAFDPTTGFLYGVTNNNSAAHPHSLIRINTSTGAGTFIGDLGLVFSGSHDSCADIAFDSSGQLWGWESGSAQCLVKINKSTGAAVRIGTPGGFDSSGGLDFDGNDTLWHIFGSFGETSKIDLVTGDEELIAAPGGFIPCGKFSSDSLFWGVELFGIGPTQFLETVQPYSGVKAVGATLSLTGIDAIAWKRAAFAPNFALSLPAPDVFTFAGGRECITLEIHQIAGDTEAVTLSASGQPAGVTVTFAPSSTPVPQNVDVCFLVSGAAVAGGYTVTLTATGTVNTHSIDVRLHIDDGTFAVHMSERLNLHD